MKGPIGFVVNAVACAYIMVFRASFCSPASPGKVPVTAANMNCTCLIVGGFAVLVGLFWWWKRSAYVGPRDRVLEIERRNSQAV